MSLSTTGIDAILAGLDKALDRAADQTADQIVQLEIARCPVGPDHGQTHLYETIRKAGEPGSGARQVIAGDASQGVLHAPHVNYGTRRMAARPFVEPAVERADLAGNVARELAHLTRGG